MNEQAKNQPGWGRSTRVTTTINPRRKLREITRLDWMSCQIWLLLGILIGVVGFGLLAPKTTTIIVQPERATPQLAPHAPADGDFDPVRAGERREA